MLSLICLDNVLDNIIWVLNIDSQHLYCLSLILNLLQNFLINRRAKIINPYIILCLVYYSWVNKLCSYEEVLMNIMNKVFKISVYASFSIYSCLLTCQKMVELHYTYRERLIFLTLNHQLPQLDIFYKFNAYCMMKITWFC